MTSRLMGIVTVLAMLAGLGTLAFAADQSVPEPPVAMSTDQPDAVMPEIDYRFDPVVDGALVTHDFVIKNAGGAPLDISQVKTG